ncbi:CPBP family intramembrane glutamic endopeptidase [Sphingomonas lacusdianchii]|uniref:CPBP family intramembrane glutamic endopeptidase n=1 Tax=Sphingomonas lacusdianchii TaxID=2917992 RepID=UPI001F5AA253|nr:CPBP family intramembrane glutamic endopeptidase [Sphingomonas sp. JXJ CY 53]
MNEMTVGRKEAGASATGARTPAPSLWLVAGPLVTHQLALTVIHYGLGPAVGLESRSALLTAVTIVTAALLLMVIVAFDLRKPERAEAVLLRAPQRDGKTVKTMVIGLAIAQIPLGILALQGATVWQSGAASNLEVGRALVASLSGPAGLALLGATVIVAPMVEELLYRGYLVGAVIDRLPGFVAVILSAFLFVTLHFEPANLVASLCLGLGAAFCAVRTRSLVPGLVVHVVSNAFGMWYATLG